MSIHSHARCDQCEKALIPLDDDGLTEDYLLDTGWVVIKWIEGDEEDRVEVSKDFCGFVCASHWTAHEVAAQPGKADDRAGA